MCVGSQTAVSVIRGWSDIGVLTRAVKTLSHVTEVPGERKTLNPYLVRSRFLKTENRSSGCFFQ